MWSVIGMFTSTPNNRPKPEAATSSASGNASSPAPRQSTHWAEFELDDFDREDSNPHSRNWCRDIHRPKSKTRPPTLLKVLLRLRPIIPTTLPQSKTRQRPRSKLLLGLRLIPLRRLNFLRVLYLSLTRCGSSIRIEDRTDLG